MIVWKQVLVALVATFLAACGSQRKEVAPSRAPAAMYEEGEATPSADSSESDDDRPTRQKNTERRRVGVEDLVRSNNRFAFDLFKSLPEGNVFVSPHGVASALGIAYAGADGETAAQIRATLRATISERDVHRKFGQLHDELRKREKHPGKSDARAFRLRVVNGVWFDEQIDPTARFLRLAHNKHYAELEPVSFRKEPDAARLKINGFVSDATGGAIPDLLAPELVTAKTRVVIANAVHFDAPWEVPFKGYRTSLREFAAPSGPRKVPTMRMSERFPYLRGDGFELIELPYAGGEVVATIILPDGDANAFSAGLDADYFEWMVSQARNTDLDIQLPKFEVRSKQHLADVLEGMGMPDAFAPHANFERLTTTEPLHVSEVVHEAWVRVNEEGTEAAAATAIVVDQTTSAPMYPPVEFIVDRPFLFLIRDVPSGAILFQGRVVEP